MIDDKFIAEIEGILPLVYDESLSYYEVLEKVTYLLNQCIQKVNNIADPVIYTPTVNEDGTISWTNNGGLPNPEPVDISGPVGPAPSISVTDITGGHRITIIDEDHPDGINIDVMNGAKGEQGDAGVSPAITITDVLGGHRITITDAAHPQGQNFDVMNGDKGEQGDAGISPTVTITDILGGHRITITDAAHPQGQNFDVMNGAKGDTGAGVPAGGSADDILVKNSNTDYDAKWTKTPVQMGSLATIETSPATAAHAVGEYIVLNGQLYKVTAAIAAGQTLTVGTNIEAVKLAEDVKILNDKDKTYRVATGINSINVFLKGNLALLSVTGFQFTASARGWHQVTTLPTIVRPTSFTVFTGFDNLADNVLLECRVETNGDFYVYAWAATTYQLRCNATYFTSEDGTI